MSIVCLFSSVIPSAVATAAFDSGAFACNFNKVVFVVDAEVVSLGTLKLTESSIGHFEYILHL